MHSDSQSSVNCEDADAPRDLRLQGALVRTALSSEQTLMSWVRTALSMVTFGFSIAQFFFFLGDNQDDLNFTASPNRLGVTLICFGVIVLVLASAEHLLRIRALKSQGLPKDSGSIFPIGSAIALMSIAIAALISVLLGWQL